jgi:NADPH-dependent 2,4-dienoyl-CoA reductase/sulfur reductase-like enzyme/pSer/pThr/pTyr-binding forkhead associated (FHA) protein/Fe-S-cluster-containing hydrogenase component 2/CRP-like cAMP-binding protein
MGLQQAYVIIGNGITGVTTAEILRAEDASCSITIVADDPFPAYYRPALKDFLGGRLPEEKLWARPATFYQEHRIRFIPGRVVVIDTLQRFVQLQNGMHISYSKLLLANGARPRQLSCSGLDLAGVSTLRTVADYQEILRRLSDVNRVVVYGSGTLALESAETLRHRGYQVTHLMRGNTLWSEVLDPVASDLVLQEERRDGIDVRTGEEIAEIVGRHRQVSGIITSLGERIPCEMVLIAIGIEPMIGFIRASGIDCGRGVKVDNGMRTNIPDIYAAGDVIETTSELTGRTRVLGQWFPSIQQAQVAAYNMLGLLTPDHPFYPGSNNKLRSAYINYYNATFLYGLDFVAIGSTTRPSSPGFQEIIADPQPRSYRKVILQNGTIVGALLLGDREQALAFKRAIDHRVNLAPIDSQLFTADFNLDAWLDQQRIPEPILNINKESASKSLSPAKQGVINTPSLTGEEYTRNFLPKDIDAFLVHVPHPKIHVSMAETQLNNNGQSNVNTIGRQSGVFLVLDHISVSRLHAEITCSNGEYLLRDKGSSNGTFINGAQVTPGTVSRLRHNDRVRFGDVLFRFELRTQVSSSSYLGANTPPDTSFLHIQGTELYSSISRIIPASILHTLDDTPTLVLVGQNTSPEVVPLTYDKRYTLGRDKQNDIVLDDTSSSRQHAEIFSAPDGFYVRDLNSRYGVFVNRARINNAYHLTQGDRIVLGNMLVYFSYPQGSATKHAASSMINTMQQTPQSGILKDETVITNAMNRGSVVAINSPPEKKEPVVVGLEHRRAVQRLGEECINFEIDMCIGCNRCMDACPVPISSQVTIADLNSASTSASAAPHVTRFTHECIMCGSCVPVCPVDNHRDLLMLSLKERLGVSWNSIPDMNSVAGALPTGWTIANLISRLREQAILCDPLQVPDTYLLHIIAASKQSILTPGETVIREGEYGRDLYLILEGRLELMAADIDNSKLPIAILRRGEYVGEDGMLTGHPYKASARAQTTTLLLEIPEQVMQRLMELVPGVRNHFERFNNTRSLKSILKRLTLFLGVADADLQSLTRQTPVKQYERDERLFAEGNRGRPSRETLHILLEGFVKVTRHTKAGTGKRKSNERIIAYRQGGDYFAGGLDLLGDGQAVTVTTINRCRVAEVPRHVLLNLFQQYPEVEQRFSMRLREYIETTISTQGYALSTGSLRHFTPTASPPDLEVQAGLHSLVSDGVVEGTEVLVIDLDKCIHCNECEEACERRHGHSRMNRKGMVIGNISIATACRQCQDPVCMLCSRAGIARYPNGEVYITESCIGCGICAERCPYGAISIVQIEDESVGRPSWQRFSEFFTRGADKEHARKTLPVVSVAAAGGNYVAPGPFDITQPRSGYDELRKKVAIKCDLCAGYSDQACVQACPTGAAIRIQPIKFFGSTEEILQRRAN